MAPRRALAGLLAAPVLVLTGCGDGSSVADPPVHSPPHSVATSDPPAHETAEHFIRRFYAAEQEMENSGETSEYERLTTARCKPCAGLVQQVHKFYGAGGFIHWGGLHIASISKFGSPSEHGPSYSIKFTAMATKYKESAASPTERLPGGESTDVLTLDKAGQAWVVVARARLSS